MDCKYNKYNVIILMQNYHLHNSRLPLNLLLSFFKYCYRNIHVFFTEHRFFKSIVCIFQVKFYCKIALTVYFIILCLTCEKRLCVLPKKLQSLCICRTECQLVGLASEPRRESRTNSR